MRVHQQSMLGESPPPPACGVKHGNSCMLLLRRCSAVVAVKSSKKRSANLVALAVPDKVMGSAVSYSKNSLVARCELLAARPFDGCPRSWVCSSTALQSEVCLACGLIKRQIGKLYGDERILKQAGYRRYVRHGMATYP